MFRSPLIYVFLFLLGCLATLAYQRLDSVTADAAGPSGQGPPETVEPAGSPPSNPVQAADPEDVKAAGVYAGWVTDAQSDDAEARAVAIAALAQAPEPVAMPVLLQIMAAGTLPDRERALFSLGQLGAASGDATGQIRNALRAAAYHNADDSFIVSARNTLDNLETLLATPTRINRPPAN